MNIQLKFINKLNGCFLVAGVGMTIKQTNKQEVLSVSVSRGEPSGVPARISVRLSACRAPPSCFTSCVASSLGSAFCESEAASALVCFVRSGGLTERLFGPGRAREWEEGAQRGTYVMPSFSSSFR